MHGTYKADIARKLTINCKYLILMAFFVCAICCIATSTSGAFKFRPYNYDESKVGHYPLPDLLVLQDGEPVTTATMWYKQRRPELLNILENQMFGRTPTERLKLRYGPVSIEKNALNGKAIRTEVTIYFSSHNNGPKMHLLLYVPANAHGPVPVFLGLNWGGNQTVADDPGIRLTDVWVPEPADRYRLVLKSADTTTRGNEAGEWQVEKILSHGYAFATAYDCDIEPDFDGGIKYGVRPLFFKKNQTKPASDDWGAIGAWAWGMSQAVDYLQTDRDINARRIVAVGHSRLGKAALWAGAQDTRFAIVISNESGKGGAALLTRDYGETIEHLNVRFPYWFSATFKQYSNHLDKLHFDSNMLLALIAPRPLYIASALPKFLDPKGEFLATVSAGSAYQLLGKNGLDTDHMPPLDTPIMHTIGYHVRPGKHDMTSYDWDQFIKFSDMHFGRNNK